MAGAAAVLHGTADHAARFESKAATREPGLVKWGLITLALSFFAFFLLLPLVAVFYEALRKGWDAYFAATGQNLTYIADGNALVRGTFELSAVEVRGVRARACAPARGYRARGTRVCVSRRGGCRTAGRLSRNRSPSCNSCAGCITCGPSSPMSSIGSSNAKRESSWPKA